MGERFRVEIFEYKTGEVCSVIGEGMDKEQAEKRALLGLSRCNSDYGTRLINEETGECC